jgi:hypothetical protein
MDLEEVEWGAMDWIDLAQDRDGLRNLVNEVIKVKGSLKCR